MPAAYLLYARKSTEEEDRQVLSIDAQLHELREYAQREGLRITEEFIEAKTAKQPGRPVFDLMLKHVEDGRADGLLAWHPDRLARNSVDGGRIIYLVDIGKLADLRFPTYRFDATAQGKFMLSIAFGQSKYYIDNLVENVRRGMREKLRRGGWPGRPPLGYISDRNTHTVIPHPEKALLMKKLFEVYAQGEHSPDELRKEVSRWGLVATAGKPVRKSVLAWHLRNPFYYGLMRHGGEHYEGSHPPLISKALFDRVQAVLEHRSRPQRRGRTPFVFVGLMHCGECGCLITAEVQKGHTYYRCTKKRGACSQRYLREEALLAQVGDAISKVAIDSEIREKILNRWHEQATEASNASRSRSRQIAQRLQACDEQMERLLDLYVAREITAEEYQRKKAKLLNEKRDLREALGEIERGGGGWLEPATAFLTTCQEAGSVAWQENPPAAKQFLKTVGSNFTVKHRRFCVTYGLPFGLVAQTHPRDEWLAD